MQSGLAYIGDMKTNIELETKKSNLVAGLTIEGLIEAFEATDSNNSPEIPTVRGWIMDEMEKRNAAAFNAWIEGDATVPARKYFLN